MKKTITLAIISVFFISNLFGQNSKQTGESEQIIIGQYSYWVTSMCSQNCDNISVGSFKITRPIYEFPMHKTFPVRVAGKFVIVKELPTVAGPNPKVKNRNESIEVKKFQVNSYSKFNFPQVILTEENKKLLQEKKEYEVKLLFENPFEFDINFKYKFNNDEYESVVIQANTKKEILKKCLLFDNSESYRIDVRNSTYKSNDFEYAKKLEKEKLIFDVNINIGIYNLM